MTDSPYGSGVYPSRGCGGGAPKVKKIFCFHMKLLNFFQSNFAMTDSTCTSMGGAPKVKINISFHTKLLNLFYRLISP